jgi:Ala-tRNA(Pro) deacylase
MLFPEAEKPFMADASVQTAPIETPLPTPPALLFARLDELGIKYKVHQHPPVFTVAESEHVTAHIPGVHCRNLFIRDKAEKMFLVVVANEIRIDIKKLQALLGCGRRSFGAAERLWRTLGIRPGSVCPFAIINDKACAVTVILDKSMMGADIVNYHPMENHMTIGLTPGDLLKFVESCGHKPHIIDLGPAAPEERET